MTQPTKECRCSCNPHCGCACHAARDAEWDARNRTIGEFVGVVKLASKAWNLHPGQVAALVVNTSSRALTWLKDNAPEEYAALANLGAEEKR